MSMDEKTKALAELAAEAVVSETLTVNSDSAWRGEARPRVSEVDKKLDVNGNVERGANDGISLLMEVHRSLENVDGREKERGGQERGRGDLIEGMNREGNLSEKMEDEMVDGGMEEDDSRDDTGSEKHVYAVGDFVWGKIKSHPWWPGRVYDASHASEFAMKYNQTGRLLVAYFGDGSFSWCPSSQLVPFVDNFEKMAKQSTSKSFFNAVEKALEEVSLLVEFGITCQCIPEESRAGVSWPLAVNAGIKKGVQVPEGETVRLLLSQCEPADVLRGLKHHAQISSHSNILEFAVLKSWLSAFYRAKCGCPLPLYCEPLHVEGLEDKKRDQVIDANDFSIPIEVPIRGPPEEEWLSSSKSGSETVPVGDKIYHKRKQKSVAELMGNGVKPKGKKTASSSVETSQKKKRKSGEQAEGHTSSSKGVDENVRERVSEKSDNTDSAKTKLSVSIPERDENGGPLSRERKKSKYLSPPYTSPKWSTGKSSIRGELEAESQKVSEITRIGERMTKAARLILSSPDASNDYEAVNEKNDKGVDDVHKSSPTEKLSSMNSDTMDINSSVTEVLSEIQSSALNPRNGSLEKTKGFISTFRDSVYVDGSNYKQYQKVKTGKKRKSSESGNAKKRKTNHVEAEVTKHKKKSVILMVTFATGFSLPSDEEIFRTYSKFGNLNKKETKVLHDSNSVQIIYRRGSDAEEAFRESVKQSPFGAAQVNYRLSYPSSDASKTSGSGKESSARENSEIPLSSLKVEKGKSQVQAIKQKLKVMGSILEKCNGKITTEEKSELEGEIKGLLEKIVPKAQQLHVCEYLHLCQPRTVLNFCKPEYQASDVEETLLCS